MAMAGAVAAGNLTNLRDAARQTVMNNPEVLSAFNEFQAAEQQVKVARGGYFPRLDLEAGVGKEWHDDPRYVDQYDFGRDRVGLALSQMLYDGFATRNEVKKLDYAVRVRYFEVMNVSERLSAEVSRAYYDVLRHRELVELSKENYAAHRLIYEQIERRVQAGISRRVDLEQAYGRLALSESNLLTDVTNLHDVSMRYQRIVGEAPAASLDEPVIAANLLPGTVDETLGRAYAQNPLMNAVVSNVWSANSAADVGKALFQPRFDVRARGDVWHDKDNVDGRTDEGVVELVMTYNLFNGGSDVAERRRLLFKRDQALDQRDQTCRDLRQEVSIAFNEMRALDEQLIYLDRHQSAIGKAREAYRSQFDIGQRTLLDMLDTENEYYDARRAYIRAKRDHGIAYTRTLAGVGALVNSLELGNDLHPMDLPGASGEEMPDMGAVCPPEADVKPLIDKDAIYREAISKQGSFNSLMAPSPEQRSPSAAESADGAAPASPAAVPAQAPKGVKPPGW